MQEQIQQQMDALNRSHDELEHLVRHDSLTGLPNRRFFQERLDDAYAVTEAHGMLGHELGDAMLVWASRRWARAVAA